MSNGSNSQSITVSPNSTTTTYTVTVTDLSSGCSDTDEAVVEISNETLIPGTIGYDQSNCEPFDPEILESVEDATGECGNEIYEDCCSEGDKPYAMTFKYNGDNCGNSNNSQGSIGGKWDCNDFGSGPNGDISVYIETNDDFSGTVAINADFTITNGGSNLSNPVVISIYSSQGGTLLQEVEVHSSCSAPIVGGDQFGSMILMNTEFQNGFSCSGISNNIFYQWQVLNSNEIWEDIPNETSETYDPPFTSVDQTYRRLAINCCGEASSNEVYITINQKPNIDLGQDVSICLGSQTILEANATGGEEPYSYAWPFGLGSGNTKTVAPTETTTYVVTVTDANNCTNTGDVTVIVNLNPTAEGVDGEICAGYDDGTVSVDPSGGQEPYSYIWSNGATTQSLINLGPSVETTYTVTVTDDNGCSVVVTSLLSINPNPILELEADQVICFGSATTIYAIATNGMAPYTYSIDGQNMPNGEAEVSPSSTTTYEVEVTDAKGCVDISTITITVEEKATVGDFTWNDTNFDGVQDLGENGINGVSVEIYDAGTDELIESTTTVSNGGLQGYYQFSVCKGTYYIVFGDVANTTRSPKNSTAPTDDSDANESTGKTDNFILNSGDNNQTVDAGYSPVLKMQKDIGDISFNANGSYTVGYIITVTNDANGSASYSLKDTPLFDDDITINSGTYSGQASGPMNTNGSTTLAINAQISGASTHIYSISLNVTLDLETGSSDGGDNIYTECFGGAGNSGNFGPNQGLYNKAELDRNGDDLTDIIDDACGDLPYLNITKVAGTPVAVGDGTYDISYTVTVVSVGGVGTNYDLSDTPKFDDDVIINSGGFSGQNSGSMNLTSGVSTTFATNQSIGASPSEHSYTVMFNVTLDLEDVIGDNEYEPCSPVCNPD
ncbi:MAG: hypothetical protein ACI9P5_003105, partial [Saprospiraceae bacterium]